MTLADYLTLITPSASRSYATKLACTVRDLERFAERTLTTADISAPLINSYLRARPNLSGPTLKWRRATLLRLWSMARHDPAVADRPGPVDSDRVDVIRRRCRPPSWTAAEVRELLATSNRLRGYFGLQGSQYLFSRRRYWVSYILTQWSTQMLRRQMLSVTFADLQEVNLLEPVRLAIRQWRLRGTRDDAGETVIRPDDSLAWPLWCHDPGWFRCAAWLINEAGLRGTLGRLRHSPGAEHFEPLKGVTQ